MNMREELIKEIENKYSEYLEMEGADAPFLMIKLLASLLLQEKEKNEYYERMLKVYVRT